MKAGPDVLSTAVSEPGTSGNTAPSSIALSGTEVAESAAPGTIVGLLSGTDPDADGNDLFFTLTADGDGRFAIQDNSLVLAAGAVLDYETTQSYEVTVHVTDRHGAFLEKTFTIQVGDVSEGGPEPGTEPGTIAGGAPDDGGDGTEPGSEPGQVLAGRSGRDCLIGGAGDDTLSGGRGNDTLLGGLGDDVLRGGAGKDTLTGGAGEDTFLFDSKPAKGSQDRITDFTVSEDTIQLARTAFKGIGHQGELSAGAFHIGAKAHDASDRIIYNDRNGKLYFDADGTGKHAAVEIAVLAKGLHGLSQDDFWIV